MLLVEKAHRKEVAVEVADSIRKADRRVADTEVADHKAADRTVGVFVDRTVVRMVAGLVDHKVD